MPNPVNFLTRRWLAQLRGYISARRLFRSVDRLPLDRSRSVYSAQLGGRLRVVYSTYMHIVVLRDIMEL